MNGFKKNKQYFKNIEFTAKDAQKELLNGLKLLKGIDQPIVTVFGGHKLSAKNEYYKQCKNFTYKLGKRGYAVLTGGGPGIMHAANLGAKEAGTKSIGIRAKLIKGEPSNDDVFTDKISFKYLFVRRFILGIKSDALVFFPGGYGTLNELFEYVVLVQTGMADKVPIICVNKEYWKGLFQWLMTNLPKHGFLTLDARDLEIFYLVDDIEDAIKIIVDGK